MAFLLFTFSSCPPDCLLPPSFCSRPMPIHCRSGRCTFVGSKYPACPGLWVSTRAVALFSQRCVYAYTIAARPVSYFHERPPTYGFLQLYVLFAWLISLFHMCPRGTAGTLAAAACSSRFQTGEDRRMNTPPPLNNAHSSEGMTPPVYDHSTVVSHPLPSGPRPHGSTLHSSASSVRSSCSSSAASSRCPPASQIISTVSPPARQAYLQLLKRTETTIQDTRPVYKTAEQSVREPRETSGNKHGEHLTVSKPGLTLLGSGTSRSTLQASAQQHEAPTFLQLPGNLLTRHNVLAKGLFTKSPTKIRAHVESRDTGGLSDKIHLLGSERDDTSGCSNKPQLHSSVSLIRKDETDTRKGEVVRLVAGVAGCFRRAPRRVHAVEGIRASVEVNDADQQHNLSRALRGKCSPQPLPSSKDVKAWYASQKLQHMLVSFTQNRGTRVSPKKPEKQKDSESNVSNAIEDDSSNAAADGEENQKEEPTEDLEDSTEDLEKLSEKEEATSTTAGSSNKAGKERQEEANGPLRKGGARSSTRFSVRQADTTQQSKAAEHLSREAEEAGEEEAEPEEEERSNASENDEEQEMKEREENQEEAVESEVSTKEELHTGSGRDKRRMAKKLSTPAISRKEEYPAVKEQITTRRAHEEEEDGGREEGSAMDYDSFAKKSSPTVVEKEQSFEASAEARTAEQGGQGNEEEDEEMTSAIVAFKVKQHKAKAADDATRAVRQLLEVEKAKTTEGEQLLRKKTEQLGSMTEQTQFLPQCGYGDALETCHAAGCHTVAGGGDDRQPLRGCTVSLKCIGCPPVAAGADAALKMCQYWQPSTEAREITLASGVFHLPQNQLSLEEIRTIPIAWDRKNVSGAAYCAPDLKQVVALLNPSTARTFRTAGVLMRLAAIHLAVLLEGRYVSGDESVLNFSLTFPAVAARIPLSSTHRVAQPACMENTADLEPVSLRPGGYEKLVSIAWFSLPAYDSQEVPLGEIELKLTWVDVLNIHIIQKVDFTACEWKDPHVSASTIILVKDTLKNPESGFRKTDASTQVRR